MAAAGGQRECAIIIERNLDFCRFILWARDLGRVVWDCTDGRQTETWTQVGKWVTFVARRCAESDVCNWTAEDVESTETKMEFKLTDWDRTFVLHSCPGIVVATHQKCSIIWNEMIGRVYVDFNKLTAPVSLAQFAIVEFRAVLLPLEESYSALGWLAQEVELWTDDDELPSFPTLKLMKGTFSMTTKGTGAYISSEHIGQVYFSGLDYYNRLLTLSEFSAIQLQLVCVPALKHLTNVNWRALYVQPDAPHLLSIEQMGFPCTAAPTERSESEYNSPTPEEPIPSESNISTPTPAPQVCPLEEPPLLPLPDVQRLTFEPGQTIEGRVTQIHTDGRFFIQPLAHLRSEPEINGFMSSFYEMFGPDEFQITTRLLQRPGCPCAVKWWADGRWYRAKYLESVSRAAIKVLFVDYGREEIIDVTDSKIMVKRLDSLPALAVQCWLSKHTSQQLNKGKAVRLSIDQIGADGSLFVTLS